MKATRGVQCAPLVAGREQILHTCLRILPLRAQGLDDGGDDQALHIGPRRVVGAQLRALARIERSLEQRPEIAGSTSRQSCSADETARG